MDTTEPADVGSAPLSAASWQVVPSIDIGSGTFGNKFNAAAAIAPDDAWAVGFSPVAGGALYEKQPLAEHWDGSSWSVVATPGIGQKQQEIDAVAALGSSDVWAVGYGQDPACLCQRTLVEHWDGALWSVVPSPSPGVSSSLDGVAAISTNDVWAVGAEWPPNSTEVPLLMHWNGTAWKTSSMSTMMNSALFGVAALSSKNVWAIGIGYLNTPLVLRWNGSGWHTVSFPIEQGVIATVLRGIAAIAPNDIWVVGFITVPYGTEGQIDFARTYHWDGASWTIVASPLGFGSTLTSVTKIASNDVWAVGDNNGITSTMHWDGSAWTLVSNPGGGTLFGVSADATDDAWAVGQNYALETFTVHYAP